MGDCLKLSLDERFKGLLVVGDIHGHLDLLLSYTAFAFERDLLLISVGDLIDRGPSSFECMRLMRENMVAGRAIWLKGNHEDKLYRCMIGRPVRRTDELNKTLNEFEENEGGSELREWFIKTFNQLPFILRFGDIAVAHGGFGIHMLDLEPFPQPLRFRALFGQPSRERRQDNKPERLYHWVAEIPKDFTVLIGHDPCCKDYLIVRQNDYGGRLIHMDSGAGKGGPLSALQINRNGMLEGAWQITHDNLTPSPISIGRPGQDGVQPGGLERMVAALHTSAG